MGFFMTTNAQGVFVAFEGVDGAGKSTQLHHAATLFRRRGIEVIATREPGGTFGAEQIRALLVTGAANRWSAQTELLLFNAARRDHVEKVIRPALNRGAAVFCDRFIDSTRAYQSAGRGAARQEVDGLHNLMIGLSPDITLIFDVEPELARRRGRPGHEDRFEAFGQDFFEKLRFAYLQLAAEFPQTHVVIDAQGDEDSVAAVVTSVLAAKIR